ncbi:putative RNA-directed DNA polymerase [Helianthus annuus]|nr:putative RNA-directed DNA polymerase [Helianthus annuus]KAJ0557582.1 putative RNA-directed DNA polymerase [Helianthus annuus]KAJ0563717.1 putative RNA-directed DNA polymerase [Helianthus annuus]KAJ0729049.1 putative RNA-directed DNA polymerase [Helianthus annuus]
MATSQDIIHMPSASHLPTIKLSSANYLVWRTHMRLLLSIHKLSSHIDGSSSPPSETTTVDGKSAPNPEFVTWTESDQKAALLILSSLTEEAAAEVLGLNRAKEIWSALENLYSNASAERVQNLRDSLSQLQKGTSSVTEFSSRFKLLCEKLAAIGHPVTESDKLHWFLRGLGPSYEIFSTAIRAVKPAPLFRDLVTQAESHELFSQSIHGTSTPPAAFHVQNNRGSSTPSRGRGSSSRGNFSRGSNGRGRGQGRRPPHCQLCRTNGHYASACPSLRTYAAQASQYDESLAKAFHAQCHVTNDGPDWNADTGATDHMTPTRESLHHSVPYKGNHKVIFGNGMKLPITHTGSSTVTDHISLRDVLVIPSLTKKLLSISKLTADHPVDVLFSKNFFHIQDRTARQVLARGVCEGGLYVLKNEPRVFVAEVVNKASYELWHARLGHVSFDVISSLNKCGVLSVSSLLPKPTLCASCQLAKGQRLPFISNIKRASNPLDLIHCDLWGPAPVTSTNGYRYYVIFIDDYSRFTWLYPLKTKTGFYSVLPAFIKLVQTQCSRKIKVFQSDGGSEFVNHTVRKIFEDNGTFHRYSCPYTPQQNGRAERKHRHIVETGLAMLFNAHIPACYWEDAFSSATFIINRVPTPLLDNKSPFELLFKQAPLYSNFRVFGCQVFPYLRDYAKHKLEPRSLPCVFIGYSSQYKGYRCLDPSTSRIFITRHARFNESLLPFKGSSTSTDIQQLELTTFLEDISPPIISSDQQPKPAPSNPTTPLGLPNCPICPPIIPGPISSPSTTAVSPSAESPLQELHTSPTTPSPSATVAQPSPVVASPVADTTPPDVSPSTVSNAPVSNLHPMVTRAKAGIFKPKHQANFASLATNNLHIALSSATEPRGFKSASKDPRWMAAMVDEIMALKYLIEIIPLKYSEVDFTILLQS